MLLQQGHATARVAEMVGVTPRSVQRWRRSALQPRHKRKQNLKSLHRPCRLTLRQLKQLEKALRLGALAYGYAEDYWTLDRIAHVIWRLFGVRYRPSGVWRLLHRMEWSCQKPQRISFQQEAEKMHPGNGRSGTGQKKWRDLRATLVFIDENGQSLVCSLKRTWAPRGHTPKIRTRIQHNPRINTMAARLVTPGGRKIRWSAKSYEGNLTGDQVIDFLHPLLRPVRGPLVLVWHKAPIHQRKKVQEFLAQHPRVHVYNFPTSAPELKPVEFVWTQMENYLASRAPRDIKQLRTLIRAALHRTRTSPSRLWSCIYASDLPWKRKIMRH